MARAHGIGRRLLAIGLAIGCAALALPEARAQGQGAVALEWRLPKGSAVRYRHSTTQTAVQHPDGPAGTTVTTRQREEIEYVLSAIELDPATGGTRVLCRYDQVAIDLEQMSLGRVRWDSRNKQDVMRADEPAVRPYAKLLGQEFGFLLAPWGGVSELRGHDKVRAAVLVGLDESPFAKLALGSAFSDEAVRISLERSFAIGKTTGAVKVGDSWPRSFEQPVPLLGAIAYDVTSTLESLDATTAVVRFEARLRRGAAAPPPDDPVARRIEAELVEGKGSGRARFSIAQGRLERSEATFTMTVRSRLLPPVAPKDGAGASQTTSEVTQQVVVELVP